jgi:hypothetical protein
MQTIKLNTVTTKPTLKAAGTLKCVAMRGVRKTLAISPHSGRMKIIPASLPMEVDARLP